MKHCVEKMSTGLTTRQVGVQHRWGGAKEGKDATLPPRHYQNTGRHTHTLGGKGMWCGTGFDFKAAGLWRFGMWWAGGRGVQARA